MNQRVDEIKKFLSETEVTRTKGIRWREIGRTTLSNKADIIGSIINSPA